MLEKTVGFTDEAATIDLFDIDRYISGLTQFISQCRTPMTVSIQGAWGTGKTTMMNIIRENLKNNHTVQTIWFNTWQFSQFQMSDGLAISFLEYLFEELDLSDENREEVSRLSRGLRRVGIASKEVLLSVVDSQLGGRIADNLERGLSGDSKEETPVDVIRKLRNRISFYVSDMLERKGKERIVIFVDDLDRLEPRRAVELLEVLKLFFDSPFCVFVLAIDYDVVIRGVKAKYGFEDQDKGRSFFDKIIQVPFRLPIANYNITRYVENCLKEVGISSDTEEIAFYKDMITHSIGANPRAIKRLFNAFLLLHYMTPETLWQNTHERRLIFSTLCLQSANEHMYDLIAENLDAITLDDLRSILSDGALSPVFMELDNDDSLTEWKPFWQSFLELVESGAADDKERMEKLRETMALSAITSAGSEDGKKHSSGEVLDHDHEAIKVLNATDMKYKICLLGKDFHIGFDQPVQVEYEGSVYTAKMHKSAKGRVDRLSALYREHDLKEGDRLLVRYEYETNRLIFYKE